MCSKSRFAEKVGGSPAEEYIMEHDGVKTEFQITEVKQGSFAYDQGARFDVKVFTDGHDCGNGRFCADLGEAHDFCRPLPDMSVRPLGAGARELLDKLTSSETVSYFPEFNLLVTTTDFAPSELHDHESAIFNVFPSELAYGKLFQGFENVADIPYSGPIVDPIALLSTFGEDVDEKCTADKSLRSLAMLLSGSDVISTQSVPELLDTMADRFDLETIELVVSAEIEPYMDPDKFPGCEQSLDSLCEEKTDEAKSLRYGMEGVGLPMLDAAEHLANY